LPPVEIWYTASMMIPPCTQHDHCIETALARAEAVCNAHGARLTPVRKRVLALVWANHQPSKAYDLLDALQKEDPAAKPPTIYRALDFLLEHQLIHKLHRINAYIGCDHPSDDEACFFLICTKCHHVEESHDAAYHSLVQNVSKAHQFQPQAMTFEIEGLCAACA
jgi:Fur family zinc uptake transcriptional regulator